MNAIESQAKEFIHSLASKAAQDVKPVAKKLSAKISLLDSYHKLLRQLEGERRHALGAEALLKELLVMDFT